MKRFVYPLFVLLLAVWLGACGSSASTEERLVGKWEGLQTNVNGDKIPATWEFLEGGTMIVKIPAADITYGAEWSVEGNRINIVTELDPDRPTYRDVEFVSNDVIKLSKEGTEETWQRVEE